MQALLGAAKFDVPKTTVEWEAHNLMQQTVKDT
jgi:FKBP-type peptidyl-prolyl cis-trans isomerase (trigger factor)